MPVIDMHAHVTPERYKRAIATEGSWYGLGPKPGGIRFTGFARPLDERLRDMDREGVDMQLVTPTVGFYQYENELATTRLIAKECNDEVAEMVERHPDRFRGLATLPMQDVPSAVAELERAMNDLGMRGAIISDHVAGKTYDDPSFRPFFRAAEELGALLFFHQGGDTVVSQRQQRFSLGNAVGNLTERVLVFATLVFSGVIDEFPDLQILLGHGGGYTVFGIPRLDKVAGALEGGYEEHGLQPPFGADYSEKWAISRAPSEYLDRFYYDTCVYSGDMLRVIIDAVGIDRMVLGTDYPAPMVQADPVEWIRGLHQLDEGEKQAVLSDNPSALLGMGG